MHVETVALLSKLDVDKHIDVEIKLDELDLTSAESKATYAQIKEYILEKFNLKVSTLYIAQIKKKCGIVLREHYNKSKKEKRVIPQCTPEKQEAIMDALRHFKMIQQKQRVFMRWILKIILFPISLLLSILTAFLTFLLSVGTAILYLLMLMCVFAAIGSFFMLHDTKAAIEALILGFLLSPYGIPMIGATVIAFLQGINEAIKSI